MIQNQRSRRENILTPSQTPKTLDPSMQLKIFPLESLFLLNPGDVEVKNLWQLNNRFQDFRAKIISVILSCFERLTDKAMGTKCNFYEFTDKNDSVSLDIFCSASVFAWARVCASVREVKCVCVGIGWGRSSSFGEYHHIISDRTTKEERGRKSCFHISCFHSSLLPVQWNSWWSLNEAELGDQADTGAAVDGICTTVSMHTRESNGWQLTWMKSRERRGRWGEKRRRGGGGEGSRERDKGMKYLLNVIISNHL